jgi:hypothetical protein
MSRTAGLLTLCLLPLVAACGDSAIVNPAGCFAGFVDCAGVCVDLQTDRAHCGGCGHACAPGEGCAAGACTPTCTDDCPVTCEDECPAAGARECSGAGLRECGDFDPTDVCLEWSAVDPCPDGQICDPASVTCREPCLDWCDPFSIVLLPDTQYYTNKQANDANNTYRKQMRWILDRREADQIQTVVHLGDITNNNLPAQWQVADDAHAILDAAGMPYSVTPGNHDFLGTPWDRGNTLFNDYFGADRFQGRSWYGGALGGGNVSNYTFFEVGPMKFMVVSLEYAPRKDHLCAAERVIAAHPDRRVIVATHCYLTRGGGYAGNCPDSAYQAVGSGATTVWDELVSRHGNVFLVVSGHVGASAYHARLGNTGNTVHQLVVDYQFEAACTASNPAQCTDHCAANTYTGNGWLRQLRFDPRTNRVHARTSTVEDGNASFFPGGEPRLFCSELNTQGHDYYSADPQAADHDFEFEYALTSTEPYARDDLGAQAFIDRTVNSVSAGEQLAPRVAMAATGGFVVAWEDDSSSADGAGNHDVLVRGFAPGGCEAFADVVVNPVTAGQQQTPAVASDAAGNFVVAWADDQDGNGSFQIHARGFAADGSERVPTFVVNSQSAGQQLRPAIAMAPDGRFVVAWEDDPEGDGTFQVRARGFAADGSERFTDRSVHADALGQRIRPALGLDADADFVVAWQDDSDGNGAYQIHARGFAADGSERFAAQAVNSVATGQQRRPAIGLAADGAFVVAWEDDQDGDGQFRILARGFTSAGAGRLPDFVVPSSAAGNHLAPAVSVASDGAFLVTWQADPDANGTFQIAARAWRADGSEWIPQWTVNRVAEGQQLAPDAALGPGVVVAWQDDMDGNGVHQILARGLDLP